MGANLSIGSGTSKGADVNITTLGGIALIGKTKLWCSDLRYRGSGGTGYSLSDLKNTESNAYIGWSLPGDWIILEGKNSGLPMPKEMADKDLMDETLLILEKGESRTLNAPFEARQWTRSSDAVCCDNGTVTAQNVGSALVTAYDGTDRQARCVVFVYEKRSSLSQTTATLQCGKTLSLTFTTGTQNDDRTVTWSSSSDAVATVENGVVTRQTPGVAIITCCAASGVSATCTVRSRLYIHAVNPHVPFSEYTPLRL